MVFSENGAHVVESVISKAELEGAFTDDGGAGNLHFVFANGETFMEDPNGYGVWRIDANGDVVFTLNNESEIVQGLNGSARPTVSMPVYAVDEHGAQSAQGVTVEVAIQGTADSPQISFEKVLTLTEASQANSAQGTFHIIDPDSLDTRESLTYSVSDGENTVTKQDGQTLVLASDYGTLTLNPADGTYHFELNNDSDVVRALQAGELYEVRFEVTATDHDGMTDKGDIIINIKGTNTAPDIEASSDFGNKPETPLVEDASDAVFTGTIVAHDVDADPGDSLTYSFTLTEAQIEAGWTVSADGKTLTTEYGTVTIDDDGEYAYTLDSGRAAGLGEGETASETFQVIVTDKYGAQSEPADVTIHIEGTNDAPVIDDVKSSLGNSEETPLVENASNAEFTGTIVASDADAGDSLTYSFTLTEAQIEAGWTVSADGKTLTTEYGTATIDDDGEYTYTLDSGRAAGLGEGETASETFSVVVKDQYGASDQADATIHIKGTNDAPVIDSATSDAQSNTGTLVFHDADLGDTHALSIVVDGKTYAVTEGKAEIDGVGIFEFEPGTGSDGKEWSMCLRRIPRPRPESGKARQETWRLRFRSATAARLSQARNCTRPLQAPMPRRSWRTPP